MANVVRSKTAVAFLAIIAVCLVGGYAQATLLVYEGFDYTTGTAFGSSIRLC